MTIADIYEAVWFCTVETLMADAFRRAVGLPTWRARAPQAVAPRRSAYAGVDFERLMREPRGVRM